MLEIVPVKMSSTAATVPPMATGCLPLADSSKAMGAPRRLNGGNITYADTEDYVQCDIML